MARNQTKRLRAAILKRDKDAFAALQKINKYEPNNDEHQTSNIQKALDAVDETQQAWAQADASRDAARDDAVAAEWEFHNLMIGAKGQVATQFGRDSNEVQSVGRKKASEYKSPRRNGKNGNGHSPSTPSN